MTVNERFKDEKVQYDIKRKAAEISASSLIKIKKNMNNWEVKKYGLLIKFN